MKLVSKRIELALIVFLYFAMLSFWYLVLGTDKVDVPIDNNVQIIEPSIKPIKTPRLINRSMPNSRFKSFKVNLSVEVQKLVYEQTRGQGVDIEEVLAIIETESGGQANLISETEDYGLMQINKCNHTALKKELGINDFLDPTQNVIAGVHILNHYKDYPRNKRLMAYNMGYNGMMELWDSGVHRTEYTDKVNEVLERMGD